jgi:hypothetical protein
MSVMSSPHSSPRRRQTIRASSTISPTGSRWHVERGPDPGHSLDFAGRPSAAALQQSRVPEGTAAPDGGNISTPLFTCARLGLIITELVSILRDGGQGNVSHGTPSGRLEPHQRARATG